jgi:hypothetical protein
MRSPTPRKLAKAKLKATDNIVGIFRFMPLIERKRLEAGKADDVGVANILDRNAFLPEQLGADFLHLVVIEDHG